MTTHEDTDAHGDPTGVQGVATEAAETLAAWRAGRAWLLDGQGRPTDTGAMVLSHAVHGLDALRGLVTALPDVGSGPGGPWQPTEDARRAEVIRLLLAVTPPRLDLAEGIARDASVGWRGHAVALLLSADAGRYLSTARAVAADGDPVDRLTALEALVAIGPDAAGEVVLHVATAPRTGALPWGCALQVAALRAVMAWDPAAGLAMLDESVAGDPGLWAVDALATVDASLAAPRLAGLAASAREDVAQAAVLAMLARDAPGRDALAASCLGHPSRAVRDAAVEALVRAGGDAAMGAAWALEDPGADVRLAAVTVLAVAGPPGRSRLRAHLAAERAGRVREAIVAAIGTGDAVTEENLVTAAEAAVHALPRQHPGWIDAGKLPPLRWRDGREAPAVLGAWMLYCQSAMGALALDPRIPDVVTRLDPAATADWALGVWRQWAAGGADARSSWCLPLAVALGDDRLVASVRVYVLGWAPGVRRAMAASAVTALVMLGSSAALHALDTIADACAGTSVGATAAAALAEEAQAQGITRETLADRVTPRLGLSLHGHGRFDYGRRQVNARVAADLSLTLTDGAGKVLKNPPSPGASDDPLRAPAACAAARHLRDELAGVVARAATRLEAAMVSGRTWTLAAWQDDILGHPVVRALAATLVWALRGGTVGWFRVGAGGRCEDVDGNPVSLTGVDTVGLVHPAELSDMERHAWEARLAALGVTPAVEQMHRAVFAVAAGDAGRTTWEAGTGEGGGALRVAAVSDLHRTHDQPWTRAGWSPLPLEGRYCPGFSRRWDPPGIEARVSAEALVLWSADAREVHLGGLSFTRLHGDRTVLALGDVPRTVFSEAVRALRAMTADDPGRKAR